MDQPVPSTVVDTSLSSEPEPPVVITERADPAEKSIYFFMFVISVTMLALGVTTGLVLGKSGIIGNKTTNVSTPAVGNTSSSAMAEGLLRPGPILNPNLVPTSPKPTPTPGVLLNPLCGIYYRKNQSSEFIQGKSTTDGPAVRSLQGCYEWANDTMLRKQYCGQTEAAVEAIAVLVDKTRFVSSLPENLNRETEFVLRQICVL